MKINRIVLTDFRSYSSLDLEFGDKLNIIYGDNGAGKSNLVEAIYYLNLARSYRVRENIHLIKENASIALINANIETLGINKELKFEIDSKAKKIYLNGNPLKKVTELAKLLNIILFIPTDVNLFRESPATRRDFLDLALSKIYPEYLDSLTRYKVALKERNALLKEDNVDITLLDVYDNLLSELGIIIDEYRSKYVYSLNEVLPNILKKLRKDESSIRIEYKPIFKEKDKQIALSKFLDNRNADLMYKQTSIGIQKEDFKCLFNEKDISIYGSQGENRLAALAIKLAPFYLAEEIEKPIVILDDVMSELDESHQANLLELIEEFGQVFITSVNKLESCNATYIKVKNYNAKLQEEL